MHESKRKDPPKKSAKQPNSFVLSFLFPFSSFFQYSVFLFLSLLGDTISFVWSIIMEIKRQNHGDIHCPCTTTTTIWYWTSKVSKRPSIHIKSCMSSFPNPLSKTRKKNKKTPPTMTGRIPASYPDSTLCYIYKKKKEKEKSHQQPQQ